jgi:hypothetical protein
VSYALGRLGRANVRYITDIADGVPAAYPFSR